MNRRVLLTTDDQVAKTAYPPLLESLGYEVELVHDGLECYQKLRQEPPDILIMESNLKWDGADGVVDQMRDDPDLFAIPVVMITDESNPYLLADWMEDPVVACLKKPFPLSDLLQNVLLADGCTYKAFVEKPR